MVNLRYHIVSLVAVFLALAIGVVMGSTVIDSATIDVLRTQQDQLRQEILDVREERSELQAALAELEAQQRTLAEEGGESLLSGRLAGVPVVMVGLRGSEVEGDAELRSLLASSGAELLGTVWLTDRFGLEDDSQRRDLRTAMGAGEGVPPAVLRRAALRLVTDGLRPQAGPPAGEAGAPGEAGAAPGEPGPTDAGPAPSPLLQQLLETGFVDLEQADGVATDDVGILRPGARVVLLGAGGAGWQETTAELLLQALAAAPTVPTVVVEGAPDGAGGDDDDEDVSERGMVALVRDSELLAGRLSTVDNISSFPGRLAAVLTVDDLGRDRVGHYGTGAGAQRLLPAASR
jgi:hypothetical protein